MLIFLTQRLVHFAQLYLSNPTNQHNWQFLEAYANAYTSCTESTCAPVQDQSTDLIVKLIPEISKHCDKQPILCDAIVNLIGGLTDTISENPEPALSCFLPVIFSKFLPERKDFDPTSPVVLSSILTLKRICREVTFGIPNHALSIVDACQKAVGSNRIEDKHTAWLMQCAGHALSVLPAEECQKQAESLLMAQCGQLQELCKEAEASGVSASSKATVLRIVVNLRNLFTTIDRGVLRKMKAEMDYVENWDGISDTEPNMAADDKTLESEWQPLLSPLGSIIPLIQNVISAFILDENIIKHACDFFHRLAINLDQFFGGILTTIQPTLSMAFEFAPHSSIIQVMEYTVLTHFENKAAQDLLVSVTGSMVKKFKNEGEKFLGEGSEVIIDFVGSLSTIMRKRFNVFIGILVVMF